MSERSIGNEFRFTIMQGAVKNKVMAEYGAVIDTNSALTVSRENGIFGADTVNDIRLARNTEATTKDGLKKEKGM